MHSKTTNEAPPQQWTPEAASKKLKASLGREFIKREFLKMYQKQSRSRSTLRTSAGLSLPAEKRRLGVGGDEAGGTIVDVFLQTPIGCSTRLFNRPTRL